MLEHKKPGGGRLKATGSRPNLDHSLLTTLLRQLDHLKHANNVDFLFVRNRHHLSSFEAKPDLTSRTT